MEKVRLSDIAERIGVSTVTVHNALSGNKGVGEELRKQIQEVADEMGYSVQHIRSCHGKAIEALRKQKHFES